MHAAGNEYGVIMSCLQVIGINFHPFYRNEEDVCLKKAFNTNFCTLRVLDDLYTQRAESVAKVYTMNKSVKIINFQNYSVIGLKLFTDICELIIGQ